MSRKKMVAANWKMNLTLEEGKELVTSIVSGLPADLSCEVVLAPSFIHLPQLLELIQNTRITSGAQHCHFETAGAFTGEVSVMMLKNLGVDYVIVGHSERRQLFHEDDEIIRDKVNSILEGGLMPIFCCGEPLEIRNAGNEKEYVQQQLAASLFHLDLQVLKNVIIAYEPIWAIGTGVTASPGQAQAMHAFIRSAMMNKFGEDTGREIRILYGGSIKPDNADQLFSQPDVDGGLVGGASLHADGFLQIIKAAC